MRLLKLLLCAMLSDETDPAALLRVASPSELQPRTTPLPPAQVRRKDRRPRLTRELASASRPPRAAKQRHACASLPLLTQLSQKACLALPA